MAQALSAFLSAAVRRPFVRGDHDCIMFAADWARELTGRDPAAAWRAAYASRGQASAILARGGGLEVMVGQALEAQGWHRVREPRAGNIGIIVAPTRDEPKGGRVLGVCAGRHGLWALVTARGLYIGPAPHVIAWGFCG